MREDEASKQVRRLPTQKSMVTRADGSLTDNLHERLNSLGHEGRAQLMRDISHLHTFNVCEVVNQIGVVTKERKRERNHI